MELEAKLHEIKKPIMVLGTSSGAGKSLTVTAICRILKNLGEKPIFIVILCGCGPYAFAKVNYLAY